MRRLRLFAILCLFVVPHLAWGSALGSLAVEINKLFQKVNPAVVTVKYSNGSGSFKEIVSTGVIIDKKGHVMTLRDLPLKANRAEIVLRDGRAQKADFVGYDPESKIQVLKAQGRGLSSAQIGDPEAMKAGSWVLIVGNSYGVSPSLSLGLISGRRDDNTIQLSGELTPGMSGAGVYNTEGELIGIISSTIARPFYFTLGGVGGRFEIQKGLDLPSPGPGLVLPIDRAVRMATEIIEKGEVERGWLGVYIRDLDEDLKEERKVSEGVLVTKVAEDSPAAKAGVIDDDVVIEYQGKKVKEVKSLTKLVRETKPGTKVKVTVIRDGKRKTITAEIGKKVWEAKEWDYPFELLPYIKEPLEKFEFEHKFDREKLNQELKKLKEELKELKEELRREIKKLKKERI